MTKIDELLVRELGKVGASSGDIAESLGENIGIPTSGAITSMGGSFGAKIAAKFLPTEQHKVELTIRSDPRFILTKAYAFISSNGRVTGSEEIDKSSFPAISGVVGSGFLNMNPTILSCEISAIADDSCTVIVSGAAKEGLIKQRSAAKAVDRLAAALSM